MQALHSESPLIAYLDIKSPYALVAYRPTLALEAELGLAFDWRPLTLDIPSYLGSARKEHGRVVASAGRSERTWNAIRYSYADARRYAERQGLTLKGTEKIWDSRLANIGLLWVARQQRSRLAAFLEAMFPPFWRRELDIEDVHEVCGCMQRAGVESRGFMAFCAGEGGALHDHLQTQFHDCGIYGVPTYVIDGLALHGREHIPYLRWRLTGARGPAPDIAYELRPMITAYIDFKSPAAYLALAPTLDLATKFRAPLARRPFRSAERDIPLEGVSPTLAERHHRVREASLRATHRLYAELRGLSLCFPSRQTSTDLALGVLCELNCDPLDFIEAAFSAYWNAHLDLDDPAIVSRLLEESGVRHLGDLTHSREALTDAQCVAERSGIVDAPGYLVDGQVFVGRQHLPWMGELLGQAHNE